MGAFHVREGEGVDVGAGTGFGTRVGVEADFGEDAGAGIDGGPLCVSDGDGIAVGVEEDSSVEDDGV